MARLDVANMNRTPRSLSIRGYGTGRGIHVVKAKVRARIGAILNMDIGEVSGCRGSLLNSLTALAMG